MATMGRLEKREKLSLEKLEGVICGCFTYCLAVEYLFFTSFDQIG